LENEQQSRRISRLVIIALGMVLLVAALVFIRIYLNTLFSSSNNLMSLDWAGYVVTSDFVSPQPLVVGINGSWTIPEVNVSQRDTFSAAWMGIGGLVEGDETLIQTGTEQDSLSGTATYSAWYELLPNDSVTITTINMSQGDEITASINLVDSATNEWSIEMVDATKGQSFQENFIYDSSKLSAEWIVERPSLDSSLTTLANFGNVTFTNSRMTMNSTVGTIGNFSFARITMQNRQNRQLVTVSSLSSDGSSFTVTYLSPAGTTHNVLNKVVENKIAVATRKVFCFPMKFNEEL
jgi:hypothetical protein